MQGVGKEGAAARALSDPVTTIGKASGAVANTAIRPSLSAPGSCLHVAHWILSCGTRIAVPPVGFDALIVSLTAADDRTIWMDGKKVASGRIMGGCFRTASSGMAHEAEVRSRRGRYETLAIYVSSDAFAALGVTEARLRWSVQGHADPWLLESARRIAAPRPPGERLAELEAGHLVLSVLAYFVRRYGGVPDCGVAKGGLSGWQLRRVLGLMEDALGEALTINRLAREASLSPYHFVRAFTRSTGVTPHRHLTALRLERAKALLEASDLPVHDVAASCGFAEPGSLTRAFKSQVGMTPTGYRRAAPRPRAAAPGAGPGRF